MARGGLDKRVSTLEQQAGNGLPELKLFYVDDENYLEKQAEIEQARRDGFHVMPIVFIGVKDETENPEYFKYCKANREKENHEK